MNLYKITSEMSDGQNTYYVIGKNMVDALKTFKNQYIEQSKQYTQDIKGGIIEITQKDDLIIFKGSGFNGMDRVMSIVSIELEQKYIYAKED